MMTDTIQIRTLKFQGITSYRESPLINFDELGFNDLFLIHGGTGSGKSTILDALIFSLYGKSASKSILENGRLRSNYAGDDLPTASEIVFSKGEVFYKVTRHLSIPKSASTEPRLTTRIYSDSDLSFSDPKKVEGTSVETILGMDSAQFAQTVILQQGKFSRFLNSTDKEREQLLKSVFNAGIYDKLIETAKKHLVQAQSLKEKDEASQQELLSRLETQLQKDVFVDEPNWKESLEKFTQYVSEVATYYYDAGDKLEELLQSFSRSATSLSERIINEVAAKVAQSKEANDYYVEKKNLYDVVEAAHSFRNKLDELEAQGKKMSELSDANTKAESAIPVLEEAENLEKARNNTDAEIYQAHLSIRDLMSNPRTQHDLRPQAESALKTGLSDLVKQPEKNAFLDLAQMLETVASQLQSENNSISEILKVKEKREKDISRGESDLEKLQTDLEAAKKNQETLPNQILIQAIRARIASELLSQYAKDSEVAANSRTLEIRDAWLRSVSSDLASELTEGVPCPVCHVPYRGSNAVWEDDSNSKKTVATKEEYEAALSAQQSALSETNKSAQRLLEAKKKVRDIEALGYSLEAEIIQETEAQVRDLGSTKAALEPILFESQEEMDSLEKFQKDIAESISNLEKEISRLNGALSPLREQLKESEKSLKGLLKEEKEDVDATAVLENNRSWIELSKALRQSVRSLEINAKLYAEKNQTFKKILSKSGFSSLAEAKKWHKDPAGLKKDQDAVLNYNNDISRLRGYLEAEESPYYGKDLLSIDEIRQERDSAKEEYAVLERQSATISRKSGSVSEISSNIVNNVEAFTQTHARLQKEYHEYRIWEELSRLLDGTTYGQRITTYFLEQRLEQILQVANHNIQVFSSGLHQIESVETNLGPEDDSTSESPKKPKGRGKSHGLGLMVRNLETNQLNTPGSLSGGEQFYVSLAVALALSQVVKMESGNASLQNIFIDEGFDTLDDNRLQEVIDVLKRMNEVSESKLTVGIISHKNKLVEEIPTGIKVCRKDISKKGEKPQSISEMEFYGLPKRK